MVHEKFPHPYCKTLLQLKDPAHSSTAAPKTTQTEILQIRQ